MTSELPPPISLKWLISARSNLWASPHSKEFESIKFTYHNGYDIWTFKNEETSIYIGDPARVAKYKESYLEKFIGPRVLIFEDLNGNHKTEVASIVDELVYSDDYYCQKKVSDSESTIYYFINYLKDIRIQVYTSKAGNVITID